MATPRLLAHFPGLPPRSPSWSSAPAWSGRGSGRFGRGWPRYNPAMTTSRTPANPTVPAQLPASPFRDPWDGLTEDDGARIAAALAATHAASTRKVYEPGQGTRPRHRRIDILIDRYIRPAHALQTTSSRDLGL